MQVAPDDLALRLDLALDEPSARFKEKECRRCGALSSTGAGPTIAGGGEQGRGLRPSTGDQPEATAAPPPTLAGALLDGALPGRRQRVTPAPCGVGGPLPSAAAAGSRR